MTISRLSCALGVLSLLPGAATASDALDEVAPKTLSVLVQVNAQGKVTSVSPASHLPPKFQKLLRSNLDEMITAPAMDKSGKPVSSEFVLNVQMQATPRPDGNYDLGFNYLSTIPVPYGAWYWVNRDGRELALASQSKAGQGPRFHRLDRPIPWERDHHPRPQPQPNPQPPQPGFRAQGAPVQSSSQSTHP